MSFNSIEFLIFAIIFFILYWKVFYKLKSQNLLILVASYVFYGSWDWRFLSLILISTIIDYILALKLAKEDSKSKRKLYLISSISINLGILFIFKYFNFFIENAIELSTLVGLNFNYTSLQIILPVGISFYTFQTLSYTIDVYRKKISPTKDVIVFASFVSFFPQLVAGPIERAKNLLPQFERQRVFNYSEAILGAKQVLWGLFKKIVIADNCAEQVNIIFNSPDDFSGSTYFLGAVLFSFQIYGDFSGYSDIAIGISRLFGIKLMNNFLYPYFSRDIAEFWRRWHISLSTWFRDYLYIPLGGNHSKKIITFRNVVLVFLISALWHGANWTFIFWGAFNALFFLPLILREKNRKYVDVVSRKSNIPSFKEFGQIVLTFLLVSLMWVFFRADNINDAFLIFTNIFSIELFSIPYYLGIGFSKYLYVFLLIFILIEWVGRRKSFAIEQEFFNSKILNVCFLYLILISIIIYPGNEQRFIYFQF